MDEENRRVTRSLSRFANVSEPAIRKEEINFPKGDEKLKIKKEDPEESLIGDRIDLTDDEGSLYGTEEEKPKVRYSQKEISVDRLPTYKGGDFSKFFKEWSNAISLHGERTSREKLFYLPMAFEEDVRLAVMESPHCLYGEQPNYELFVKDLFMIHGVEMQVEKSISEKLRDLKEKKRQGKFSLTQYIGLFKMNYEKDKERISELETIKIFLEGLNHKLARKIERELTGPTRPTLKKVIEWVDKFTIDWEGIRHEGLVFDDEVVVN
ncbi:hypothetical protein HMI54_012366 [Coelomomyces lativittatus]|nr:hypothetical protein HMI54_012366 [Coelomomyces lativittatus]